MAAKHKKAHRSSMMKTRGRPRSVLAVTPPTFTCTATSFAGSQARFAATIRSGDGAPDGYWECLLGAQMGQLDYPLNLGAGLDTGQMNVDMTVDTTTTTSAATLTVGGGDSLATSSTQYTSITKVCVRCDISGGTTGQLFCARWQSLTMKFYDSLDREYVWQAPTSGDCKTPFEAIYPDALDCTTMTIGGNLTKKKKSPRPMNLQSHSVVVFPGSVSDPDHPDLVYPVRMTLNGAVRFRSNLDQTADAIGANQISAKIYIAAV